MPRSPRNVFSLPNIDDAASTNALGGYHWKPVRWFGRPFELPMDPTRDELRQRNFKILLGSCSKGRGYQVQANPARLVWS